MVKVTIIYWTDHAEGRAVRRHKAAVLPGVPRVGDLIHLGPATRRVRTIMWNVVESRCYVYVDG